MSYVSLLLSATPRVKRFDHSDEQCGTSVHLELLENPDDHFARGYFSLSPEEATSLLGELIRVLADINANPWHVVTAEKSADQAEAA